MYELLIAIAVWCGNPPYLDVDEVHACRVKLYECVGNYRSNKMYGWDGYEKIGKCFLKTKMGKSNGKRTGKNDTDDRKKT